MRQSLATGLVLGAGWGAAEALVVVLRPWLALTLALGAPAPFDPASTAAVLLLAAWRYIPAAMVLALFGAPLLRRLGTWLSDRSGRHPGLVGGAEDADPAAPRAVVAGVVFLNLYWWTKPLWAFSWGLPFHHPQRLLLTAGWALAALVLAFLVVRPGAVLGVPGRRATWLVLLLLAVGGSWARSHEARAASGEGLAASPDLPNVLLVVVDALRADRLGCYGHDIQPPVSPHVDRLAREGVLFERAFAQAPFTWTSFGSMFTGKYPRRHGLIKMSPDQRLPPQGNRTLAEVLDELGYATGAFLTGTLSNSTGLLRGFDTYFETIVGHEPVNRHSRWSVVRSRLLLSILWNKARQALDGRLVNTEALAWIDGHRDQPFFALVHYYSTHTPYDPPEPFVSRYDRDCPGTYHPFLQSHGVWVMKSQVAGACAADGQPTWTCGHFDPARDVPHVRALYDGGVAFADDMLGDLLALLDERGLTEKTLVILTSDHGEELYDHGLFEHDWMFNTNLHIPLVLRLPGGRGAGTRVEWPVEEIDLPVTVLDLIGAGTLQEGSEPLDGRSLLPDIDGVEPAAEAQWAASENVRYIALQDRRHKLIANRFVPDSLRVFDLQEDPEERRPLDLGDPLHRGLGAELLARLASYDRSQPSLDDLPAGVIDVDLMHKLASLGYTAGVPEAALEALASGDTDSALRLLGDTQALGSNEILEEQLEGLAYQWPLPPGDG